eukprot:GHVU01089420.1.p1 GENE.GHVU01089420.1~~GHVU01089420.1.p1  ORF type:complete len:103 (-),score=6.49 GHVU01089420.1:56-364(-)
MQYHMCVCFLGGVVLLAGAIGCAVGGGCSGSTTTAYLLCFYAGCIFLYGAFGVVDGVDGLTQCVYSSHCVRAPFFLLVALVCGGRRRQGSQFLICASICCDM